MTASIFHPLSFGIFKISKAFSGLNIPKTVVKQVPTPCALPASIMLQIAGYIEEPVGSFLDNTTNIAGTVIGAIFSFPISFLAANNITIGSVNRVIKQILNGIRAFPELILAFVFLPITGLGPLTGTLAVGIHSIGTLGKLSSEVIEGIRSSSRV